MIIFKHYLAELEAPEYKEAVIFFLLHNRLTPLNRVLVEKLITSAPFLALFRNCAKRTVAKLFLHYIAPLVGTMCRTRVLSEGWDYRTVTTLMITVLTRAL